MYMIDEENPKSRSHSLIHTVQYNNSSSPYLAAASFALPRHKWILTVPSFHEPPIYVTVDVNVAVADGWGSWPNHCDKEGLPFTTRMCLYLV